VHVAARLEQHAGLDEILVSKEFAELLDAEFVLAARPLANVSGLTRPLTHYALLD
jgi:class 3 adenylate cyclase